MSERDGLQLWHDGPVPDGGEPRPQLRMLEQSDLFERHLWAVRIEDTAYAKEFCEFGRGLQDKKIKHTNLTGGAPAFCSGELLFVDKCTLIVNGCSQRYGPRSLSELTEAATAFKQSGYQVAIMGYEDDTGKPLPFVGILPEWI